MKNQKKRSSKKVSNKKPVVEQNPERCKPPVPLEPLESQIMTGYMLASATASVTTGVEKIIGDFSEQGTTSEIRSSLEEIVTQGEEYISRSLSCLKQAIEETNFEIEANIENVDLGNVRKNIFEARSALHKVALAPISDIYAFSSHLYDILSKIQLLEVAHKELAIGLLALGFRPITSEDFRKFGVTGR